MEYASYTDVRSAVRRLGEEMAKLVKVTNGYPIYADKDYSIVINPRGWAMVILGALVFLGLLVYPPIESAPGQIDLVDYFIVTALLTPCAILAIFLIVVQLAELGYGGERKGWYIVTPDIPTIAAIRFEKRGNPAYNVVIMQHAVEKIETEIRERFPEPSVLQYGSTADCCAEAIRVLEEDG